MRLSDTCIEMVVAKNTSHFPRFPGCLPFDTGGLISNFFFDSGFGQPLYLILFVEDWLASTCASIIAPRLRQKSMWALSPSLSASRVLPQTGQSCVAVSRFKRGIRMSNSWFLRGPVDGGCLLEEA